MYWYYALGIKQIDDYNNFPFDEFNLHIHKSFCIYNEIPDFRDVIKMQRRYSLLHRATKKETLFKTTTFKCCPLFEIAFNIDFLHP